MSPTRTERENMGKQVQVNAEEFKNIIGRAKDLNKTVPGLWEIEEETLRINVNRVLLVDGIGSYNYPSIQVANFPNIGRSNSDGTVFIGQDQYAALVLTELSAGEYRPVIVAVNFAVPITANQGKRPKYQGHNEHWLHYLTAGKHLCEDSNLKSLVNLLMQESESNTYYYLAPDGEFRFPKTIRGLAVFPQQLNQLITHANYQDLGAFMKLLNNGFYMAQ